MSVDEVGSGTSKIIATKLFLFIHTFTNNLTSINILVREMSFDGGYFVGTGADVFGSGTEDLWEDGGY